MLACGLVSSPAFSGNNPSMSQDILSEASRAIPAPALISDASSSPRLNVASAAEAMRIRTPFRELADEKPITEQPEGECTFYVRESDTYWSLFGNIFLTFDSGSIAKIVKGEDNTVYYFSPFGMQAVNSWLKGTIDEEGIMTFPLPQSMMELGSYQYYASSVEVKDDAFGFTEVQQYQLKFDGKNIVAVDPEMIIALTTWADSEKTTLGWSGYGDKQPLCVPQTETPLLPPSSVVPEEWGMIAGSKIGHINVGTDNNDVWFRGFNSEMPDAWVKGVIDGDRILIDRAQYMGPNYKTGHYEYMQGCSIDSVFNPDYEMWDEKFVVEDNVTMTYDPTIQLMKALENNNILFTTTADLNKNGEYQYATIIRRPVIKKQNRQISAPPMAPTIVEYSEYDYDFRYGYVTFKFPPYDVNYDLIDTADLYYELWVNGKPFVFYPDEYETIVDEMTLVPYDFTDDYWFETNGLERSVYYFFDGATSMGLKTVFTTDDITVNSDYVAIIGSPSVGVEAVGTTDVTVSEEAFDISGRRISGDCKGLRIIRKTMSDGSVKTVKEFAR